MASNELLGLSRELRDMIYTCALSVSSPVKRLTTSTAAPDVKHKKTEDSCIIAGASLLCVNRQINQEAIFILFEINVIRATRGDLCYRLARASPSIHVDLKRIVQLDISGFANSGPAPRCHLLLAALGKAPRLKRVVVDYGNSAESWCTFSSFRKHTKEPKGNYEMECTGVGQFRLHYSDRPGLDFTIRDAALVTAWAIATELPTNKTYKNRLIDLKIDQDDYSFDSVMRKRLVLLLRFHDGIYQPNSAPPSGVIPGRFKKGWPSEVSLDLRRLGEPHTKSFQRDVSEMIEDFLRKGDFNDDFVLRW